ncbi:Hypothetical_protein [Hexamita inflata]|uniref:Hypothetical_protein n=1 Tax=Hexamita inflata TaxID=28002 RepID=A0AA86P2H5_9EUKA|nr:Hypothetical protein HINF_LOCUS16869 [Hexamita inflata]
MNAIVVEYDSLNHYSKNENQNSIHPVANINTPTLVQSCLTPSAQRGRLPRSIPDRYQKIDTRRAERILNVTQIQYKRAPRSFPPCSETKYRGSKFNQKGV